MPGKDIVFAFFMQASKKNLKINVVFLLLLIIHLQNPCQLIPQRDWSTLNCIEF